MPASQGAPLKTSTLLPLIVFSHGTGGTRKSYSAACCDLASHGYLVAATEHRSVCACMYALCVYMYIHVYHCTCVSKYVCMHVSVHVGDYSTYDVLIQLL